MKTFKRRTVLRLQRTLLGECEHKVTVTRIGNGYNIRVFADGEVNQESRVYNRLDIGSEAKTMLRWEDKCGNISKYAGSSRNRSKG
jgi:hypothetical protein